MNDSRPQHWKPTIIGLISLCVYYWISGTRPGLARAIWGSGCILFGLIFAIYIAIARRQDKVQFHIAVRLFIMAGIAVIVGIFTIVRP